MVRRWCVYVILFVLIKYSMNKSLRQQQSEGMNTLESVKNLEDMRNSIKSPETNSIHTKKLTNVKNLICGVDDPKRNKRFLLAFKGGWKKRHLTYFIGKGSVHISKDAVRRQVRKALDVWGAHARLTFQEIGDVTADIKISFQIGEHGDHPFAENALAHAFFPNEYGDLAGDVHFNDEIDFKESVGPEEDGFMFYSVALHELGHSLGLQHSKVPEAVMQFQYQFIDEGGGLQEDDILGIREVYKTNPPETDWPEQRRIEPPTPSTSTEPWTRGTTSRPTITTTTIRPPTRRPTTSTTSKRPPTRRPTTTTTSKRPQTRRPTTPTPTRRQTFPKEFPNQPKEWPEGAKTFEGDVETVDEHLKHDDSIMINSPFYPEICSKQSFDAIAKLRGEIFFFKGPTIWRLIDNFYTVEAYETTIWDMFRGLPNTIRKIDAAYERPDGRIVLFTEDVYWVYDGNRFVENSNLYYGYGLPSWVRNIDAALTKDDKTFLYKDNQFWTFNEKTKELERTSPNFIKRRRDCKYHMEFFKSFQN